jgi:hypothetical protein
MEETGLDRLAVSASGPKDAIYDEQKGEYEPGTGCGHGRDEGWHMQRSASRTTFNSNDVT